MIGRLRGRLAECSPGTVVLDVGGVGYELLVPLSTFYTLQGEGANDDPTAAPVSLHVHTHVREDAIVLFGFATSRERSMFELLIAISGVGPKLALAVLSGIGVAELVAAVGNGDRERLCKIPGVGKKTAERILLELKDKLAEGLPGAPVAAPTSPGVEPEDPGGTHADALSALLNLGYSRDAARRALDRARRALTDDEPSLEAVLRMALEKI